MAETLRSVMHRVRTGAGDGRQTRVPSLGCWSGQYIGRLGRTRAPGQRMIRGPGVARSLPATVPSGELLYVADNRERRNEQLVDHHKQEEVDPVPPDPEPERLEDPLVLVVVEHGVHGQGEGNDGDGHGAHDPELAEASQHQAG